MNAESNAKSNAWQESGAGAVAATGTATRPFYWSVRRELWENRSLYIAPLTAAAVVLLGFFVNAMHLPDGLRALSTLEPARQRAAITAIYSGAGILIVVTMAVVAWFYCLDALYSERRDRSILFWKSLPVSDLTTVLSKAFIPLVAVPVITFVIVAATQLIILLLSTVVLLAKGVSIATLWMQLPLLQIWLALVYSLIVLSLWYAPIYGWLLLVSAWARRSTFLWAAMPPLAVCVVEKIAFDTGHFWSILRDRLAGGLQQGFAVTRSAEGFVMGPSRMGAEAGAHMQLLDPVKFLGSPSLWIGLVVAAALIVAAVWMRRYREPI